MRQLRLESSHGLGGDVSFHKVQLLEAGDASEPYNAGVRYVRVMNPQGLKFAVSVQVLKTSISDARRVECQELQARKRLQMN